MLNDLKRALINNKKGILLASTYVLAAQLIFSYICPTMWLFGIPCPACGLTRAGLRLMRLDFVGAFTYNPSIFLVPFGIYAYVKKNAVFFVTVMIFIVAIFAFRLTTSFGAEPLIINRNALIFRLIEAFLAS